MTIALRFVMKCEVLGLDESFQGICFAIPFLKHVNVLILTKSLQKSQVCFNQVYIIKFAKMYNLALKNLGRATRMEQGLFKF
jgi:hypothetical protein